MALRRDFIKGRQALIARLTTRDRDVTVASTIASIACTAADPIANVDTPCRQMLRAMRHPDALEAVVAVNTIDMPLATTDYHHPEVD
jgi:hypothetical protein